MPATERKGAPWSLHYTVAPLHAIDWLRNESVWKGTAVQMTLQPEIRRTAHVDDLSCHPRARQSPTTTRSVRAIAIMIAFTIACAPQPQPLETNATPVAPATTQTPSETTTRADALLADMARREAEYKKQEAEVTAGERRRQLPAVTATSTPAPATPIVVPSPSQPASTATAAPATTGAILFGGHDEAWWKNEMRTADVRAADSERQLQQARDQRRMASDQMQAAVKAGSIVFAQAQEAFNRAAAEVNRLEAQVRNDRAAVERVKEDARRADVPPGWLRWP